jgi:hypothetical protein
MVEGKSVGRTVVLLYTEGRFETWRLRVAPKGQTAPPERHEPALAAAHAVCPGLKDEGLEAPIELSVKLHDEKCRKALLELFQTDGYGGSEVEITFDIPALQSQLAAIDASFQAAGLKGLSVRYLGAGLVLSGAANEADYRRALREVFEQSVGKVALDDEVEISSPPAPAQAAPAASTVQPLSPVQHLRE